MDMKRPQQDRPRRGEATARPAPKPSQVRQVVALPIALLRGVMDEVKAAAWFAALGEPLTDGDRNDATAYATALGVGPLRVVQAHDWPEAERVLKAPDWSPVWWDREEELRRRLLAAADARYPERELWTALTELTTDAGEIVHGKAATAASRMGSAAKASIHVAAGAAAQAVYQLALARFAEDAASPFESKFRLFAAGRWPLGVVGSTLVVF
ncbi:hypothetical protein SAMN02990966_02161 [Rhodospirillales bacterium URHD0017]|nr:hypothetical protein SAMN02990966_02161 [Rhodospirillales bacterium URHD0017]